MAKNGLPDLTPNYNRLALAIVAQAAQDAKHGDIDAALYLVDGGAELLSFMGKDANQARKFVARNFNWPLWALQPLDLAYGHQ